MGVTHRFLAIGDDVEQVTDWFAALVDAPIITLGAGYDLLHFKSLGDLQELPESEQIDVRRSPVACLFRPRPVAGVLWTAGELHFLATPLRQRFPRLDAISRQFGKWLRGFPCVFDRVGTSGEWDYFLEGDLKSFDPKIFALPNAMKALSAGQYYVDDEISGERLKRLLRTLEVRGVGSLNPDLSSHDA